LLVAVHIKHVKQVGRSGEVFIIRDRKDDGLSDI